MVGEISDNNTKGIKDFVSKRKFRVVFKKWQKGKLCALFSVNPSTQFYQGRAKTLPT